MAVKKKSKKPVTAPIPKGPTKLAIVGSASSSESLAPYKDPSFEIWGLAWRKYPRVEAVFDIHGLGPHRKNVPDTYVTDLASRKHAVFLKDKVPEVPNAMAYPVDQVISFLSKFDSSGTTGGDYFASSIAYMFAFAFMLKFEEIHFYGVDLLADDEWSYQRPNLEYLIGLARGAGVRVYIPLESAMCKFRVRYGYEDVEAGQFITHKIVNEYLQAYKKKVEQAQSALHTSDGAVQAMEQLMTVINQTHRGALVGVTKQAEGAAPYVDPNHAK